jgi:hypothetical protein
MGNAESSRLISRNRKSLSKTSPARWTDGKEFKAEKMFDTHIPKHKDAGKQWEKIEKHELGSSER